MLRDRIRGSLPRLSSTLLVFVLATALSFAVPAAALAATAMWFDAKTPAPVALGGRACAVVNDQIYVLGGEGSKRVDLYDPSSDTWQANVATLTTGISLATAVSRGDYIYVIGGELPFATNRIVAFNTLTKTNQVIGTIGPSSVRSRVGAAIIGDTIYIVGGFETMGLSRRIDAFRLNADGVSGTNLGTVAQLPAGLVSMTVFASGGKLYIFGGQLNDSSYTDQCWVMTPQVTTPYPLVALSDLPIPRMGPQGAPFTNGLTYLASGLPFTDAVSYDPVADVWSTVGSLPTPRYAACDAVVNDRLYVINGWTSESPRVASAATEVGALVNVDAVAEQAVPTGGGDVVVPIQGSQVTVGYPTGTPAGEVVVAVVNTPPPSMTHGFDISGSIYDISTSAVYSGLLTITMPYTGPSGHVTVRHWNGTTWESITPLSIDRAHKTVTFQTSSLSPFGIEELGGTDEVVSTDASSTWSVVLLLVGLLGVSLALHRRRAASS